MRSPRPRTGPAPVCATFPRRSWQLTLVLADGSTLVCSSERDSELLRAAQRGSGFARSGGGGDVALRAGVHAVRGRRARPVGGDARSLRGTGARQRALRVLRVPARSDVALTRTNNRIEEPPRPRGRCQAYANDVLLTNHAVRAVLSPREADAGSHPARSTGSRLASRAAPSESTAPIESSSSPRLVRFTEMEYALPREHTTQAVRACWATVKRRGFAVPFPIEVRTVAADDALLRRPRAARAATSLCTCITACSGGLTSRRSSGSWSASKGDPIGASAIFRAAATLRDRYPEWDRFQAVRARLDPEGRFANAWTDRVLGPVGASIPAR